MTICCVNTVYFAKQINGMYFSDVCSFNVKMMVHYTGCIMNQIYLAVRKLSLKVLVGRKFLHQGYVPIWSSTCSKWYKSVALNCMLDVK